VVLVNSRKHEPQHAHHDEGIQQRPQHPERHVAVAYRKVFPDENLDEEQIVPSSGNQRPALP
jgi:hypothetical protein